MKPAWPLPATVMLAYALGACAPAARTTPPPSAATADGSALHAGARSVDACRAQIEHDAYEFADCLRLRVQAQATPGADPAADTERRLGAAFYGWFVADVHAAFGLEGAQQAATEFLAATKALQAQTGIADAALCGLVEVPCAQVLARRREAQAAFSLAACAGSRGCGAPPAPAGPRRGCGRSRPPRAR